MEKPTVADRTLRFDAEEGVFEISPNEDHPLTTLFGTVVGVDVAHGDGTLLLTYADGHSVSLSGSERGLLVQPAG